jgi:MFS family permease
MQSRTPVEIADQFSRKRAWMVAAAAFVFAAAQLLGLPPFHSVDVSLHNTGSLMWMLNTVLLLALLATGGGVLNDRQIRALVNDEVSRMNYRTSLISGFWVAMAMGLALYLFPIFRAFTGPQAAYVIVTPAVFVASLAFSFLELRAHRDE